MNSLELISVNIGLPKVIAVDRGVEVISGIDKRPVTTDTVMLRTGGIEGDGQADLENHGGADKAVYAYPVANWPWWETVHGLACRPGLFGENLTLAGAREDDVCIGDRFTWGDAELEIGQPRAPCFKLALHTSRADSPQIMTLAARCGWYLRVVREGAAPVKGAMTRVHESGAPSVREAFAAVFSARADRTLLQRIHETPSLSDAWRKQVAKKLRAFGG